VGKGVKYMPVYMGRDSCYALYEGVYVKRRRRKGIDTLIEAVGILRLICRDYRRGWTYEQGTCRKIPMTSDLFKKRVRFVVRLARLHGATGVIYRTIKRLAAFVLRKRRLPKNKKIRALAKKALAKVK